MKFKAVLFDLDGTLLNTTEGVIESAIYAADILGFEELPAETMLRFVGPPIQDSFMEWYGCSPEVAQKAADVFRTYYKKRALYKASLYPGILELLQVLKARDIKIGVATYKREDYAVSILEHFGIAPFCQSMHGADNFNRLTKADIIKYCIRELSFDKNEIVLVGDTAYDAKGAKEAGIPFLGVTYGFGFHHCQEFGEYPCIGYADNVLEILTIMENESQSF